MSQTPIGRRLPPAKDQSTVDGHFTVIVQIKEVKRVGTGFAKSERQTDDVLAVTARAISEPDAILRALTMLQAEVDRLHIKQPEPMELP